MRFDVEAAALEDSEGEVVGVGWRYGQGQIPPALPSALCPAEGWAALAGRRQRCGDGSAVSTRGRESREALRLHPLGNHRFGRWERTRVHEKTRRRIFSRRRPISGEAATRQRAISVVDARREGVKDGDAGRATTARWRRKIQAANGLSAMVPPGRATYLQGPATAGGPTCCRSHDAAGFSTDTASPARNED